MSLNQKTRVEAARQSREDKEKALCNVKEVSREHRKIIWNLRDSLDNLLEIALYYKSEELFDEHHETEEDFLSKKALRGLHDHLEQICDYVFNRDDANEEEALEDAHESQRKLWNVLDQWKEGE